MLRFKPGSIGQYFDEPGFGGKPKEVHSSTCAHCQHMTEFPSMRAMMEYVEICFSCCKLICLQCHGKPCIPYEVEVERQEMEAKLQRRIEINRWRCY